MNQLSVPTRSKLLDQMLNDSRLLLRLNTRPSHEDAKHSARSLTLLAALQHRPILLDTPARPHRSHVSVGIEIPSDPGRKRLADTFFLRIGYVG